MKLIIQIPCYNEEETLEITYNDLPKHIEGIDTIEYLIINDGSKDKTVEKARELGFHHIVSFKQNKGLAKGFTAGLDACLHLGADVRGGQDEAVVTIDGTFDAAGPGERLVRPEEYGADRQQILCDAACGRFHSLLLSVIRRIPAGSAGRLRRGRRPA